MREINSSSVTSDGTNVIITVSNCAFNSLGRRGIILFHLGTAIPEDAATLPIVLRACCKTVPVRIVGGGNATAAQMTGTGDYLMSYYQNEGILQLLTFGVTETTTPATGNN